MKYNMLVIGVLVFCRLAWAGGASIVGNGAGLMENSAQYAYLFVTKTAQKTLVTEAATLPARERAILEEIVRIGQLNSSNSERLIFISEKDNPGYFDTGITERHRIAKTGLSPSDPIYMNLDLLYTEDGKPAVDMGTLVSILAHEMGHQTGETSHAALDIIGSKLRREFLQNSRSHALKLSGGKRQIEFLIVNSSVPFRSSELLFNVDGVGSESLSASLMAQLRCSGETSELAGFQFTNGHFEAVSEVGDSFRVGFAFWVEFDCYRPREGVVRSERVAVHLDATHNLEYVIRRLEPL
jgi:hypothetical protein